MRLRRFATRIVMRSSLPGLLSACIALSGCAAVPAADGGRLRLGSAEFRGYVERVFREQNRVADELAFALEASGARDAGLAAAEDALLAACAGVNELATARRDERRLGVKRSIHAARTVADCERATLVAGRELASRAE
jgi:hypothetical protein